MTMILWEKLRNGWRIGAKQISCDAVLPIFILPVLTFVAMQSSTCTIVTFILTPFLIYYLHHRYLRFLIRTKFFLMWSIASVVMLILVFELSVVPLLEILPEENVVFILSVVGGMFCGRKTKLTAENASQEDALLQGVELGEGNGDHCELCRKRSPHQAYHCRICQTCVSGMNYHCQWLDCCIGSSNLKWYLGCLFSSSIAFIYGSNLAMTSVCHPFILIYTILLPDDCSDVYHQMDMALCFVSAVYSLLLGFVVLAFLIYHLWLLRLGVTTTERHILNGGSQRQNGMLRWAAKILCCRA